MTKADGDPALDEATLGAAMVEYQAGRADAFERLYAALAPILRRYLRSLVRDDPRAEDLVQETFLRIHRARRTYAPDQPVLPWVLAIARHVFLMERRAHGRRGKREQQPHEGLPEPIDHGAADRALEREALEQALARISVERRESVVLHHVVGLGFREIALRLGISEGAAKERSSRGVAGLRDILRGAKKTRGDKR